MLASAVISSFSFGSQSKGHPLPNAQVLLTRISCPQDVYYLLSQDGVGKILCPSTGWGEKNSDALPVHSRTTGHYWSCPSISLPLATNVAFTPLLLPSLGDVETSAKLLCSQVPEGKFYKSFLHALIPQKLYRVL